MHPKSSFCVCKSQHPRAQVSLFPTGGFCLTGPLVYKQLPIWAHQSLNITFQQSSVASSMCSFHSTFLKVVLQCQIYRCLSQTFWFFPLVLSDATTQSLQFYATDGSWDQFALFCSLHFLKLSMQVVNFQDKIRSISCMCTQAEHRVQRASQKQITVYWAHKKM